MTIYNELDEYKAGITVDLDSNSVYNAVEELLNDKEKLGEYSKNTKKLINDRFLLKNKLEGIGWFTYEVIRRFVKMHPEHEFIFLFDRPYDSSFIFEDNGKHARAAVSTNSLPLGVAVEIDAIFETV